MQDELNTLAFIAKDNANKAKIKTQDSNTTITIILIGVCLFCGFSVKGNTEINSRNAMAQAISQQASTPETQKVINDLTGKTDTDFYSQYTCNAGGEFSGAECTKRAFAGCQAGIARFCKN